MQKGRDGFRREKWPPVSFLRGSSASVEEQLLDLEAPNLELVIKPYCTQHFTK